MLIGFINQVAWLYFHLHRRCGGVWEGYPWQHRGSSHYKHHHSVICFNRAAILFLPYFESASSFSCFLCVLLASHRRQQHHDLTGGFSSFRSEGRRSDTDEVAVVMWTAAALNLKVSLFIWLVLQVDLNKWRVMLMKVYIRLRVSACSGERKALRDGCRHKNVCLVFSRSYRARKMTTRACVCVCA